MEPEKGLFKGAPFRFQVGLPEPETAIASSVETSRKVGLHS